MTLARQATQSALINILGSYGQQVVGFLSMLVLARLLTPSHFGQYGLALTVYFFFARARTFGFARVFFSVPEPDEKDVGTLLWLSAGTSLLVIALVGVASPLVRLLYGDPILKLLWVISIIALFETDGLASAAETLLRRDLLYRRLAALGLVSTALSLGVTILLAVAGWEVWALVGGYGVKTLVYFVGAWALAPRFKVLAFDRDRARYFFKHGRNMWLGGLGGFLAFQYDDLAVGTFTNAATLGNYRKAYDLSLVPLALISGAAEISEPTYAKARADRAVLTATVTGLLDLVTKVVFPIAALLAIGAPEIIQLYLGPQWLAAIPMLQALAIYAAIRPANDVTGAVASVLGRTDVVRSYGIAMSVFMLVVCTALTLWMGAIGAAFSAGMTVLLGFVVVYRGALRHDTDVKYGPVIIPPLIAIAIGGGLAYLVSRLLTTEVLIVSLLVKGAVFTVAYVAVMGVLQGRELVGKVRILVSMFRSTADS